MSTAQTKWFKVFREVTAVCSENHKEHKNIICGQNAGLCNVKARQLLCYKGSRGSKNPHFSCKYLVLHYQIYLSPTWFFIVPKHMYTEEYYTKFKRPSSKPRLSHRKYMHIISFDMSHHTWLRRLRLTIGSSGLVAFPGCPESGSKCFTSAYAVNVTLGFHSPNLQTMLELFSFGTQKRATS